MELQEKKKQNKEFDQKRLVNSFKYAFSGIKEAYKAEQNLKIHSIIAICVIIFGLALHIHYFEFLICLVLIGLVLMAEFFNTALEYVVDFISPEIHPLAKAIKDTASAGVLMMAIISFIVGVVIFLPKIIEVIGGIV